MARCCCCCCSSMADLPIQKQRQRQPRIYYYYVNAIPRNQTINTELILAHTYSITVRP
jgi:hypothetical protein